MRHLCRLRDRRSWLLQHALRVAKQRKRYLRWHKLRSIDPAPAMPGVGDVIDEAHHFLIGDENADLTSGTRARQAWAHVCLLQPAIAGYRLGWRRNRTSTSSTVA